MELAVMHEYLNSFMQQHKQESFAGSKTNELI